MQAVPLVAASDVREILHRGEQIVRRSSKYADRHELFSRRDRGDSRNVSVAPAIP
jgi:hypothetical protein